MDKAFLKQVAAAVMAAVVSHYVTKALAQQERQQ